MYRSHHHNIRYEWNLTYFSVMSNRKAIKDSEKFTSHNGTGKALQMVSFKQAGAYRD